MDGNLVSKKVARINNLKLKNVEYLKAYRLTPLTPLYSAILQYLISQVLYFCQEYKMHFTHTKYSKDFLNYESFPFLCFKLTCLLLFLIGVFCFLMNFSQLDPEIV
jgi:hypothetical protein